MTTSIQSAKQESSVIDPLVSVVIPCYGCAETIDRVLDALLTQTIAPLEIIVVNDCSPDHLDKTIMPYRKAITYIKNETNMGLAKSYNVGLQHAHAEYVMTLHCDCILEPNYIEGLLAIFRTGARVGAATGRYVIDDISKLALSDRLFLVWNCIAITKDRSESDIISISFIEGKADLFHRATLALYDNFNTDLILSAEDQDLSVRMRQDGRDLLQDQRFTYRMIYSQTTGSIAKVLMKQRIYSRGQSYIILKYGKAAFARTSSSRQRRAAHRAEQMLFAMGMVMSLLWGLINSWGWISLLMIAIVRMIRYFRISHILPLSNRLLAAVLGLVADVTYLLGAIEGVVKTKTFGRV